MIEVKEEFKIKNRIDNNKYVIECNTEGGSRPYVTIKDMNLNRTAFQFSCGINGMPHCCGLREMGGFTVYNYTNDVPEEIKVKAIDKLLEQIIPLFTNKKNGKCMTIVFTLIDNVNACNLVRKAIAEKPLFKLVKQFIKSSLHCQLFSRD